MPTAKTIPCGSCGASLAWNGLQRTVRCEYCETVNTIDDPGAKVAVVILPERSPGGGGLGGGLLDPTLRLRMAIGLGLALLGALAGFTWCLHSGAQWGAHRRSGWPGHLPGRPGGTYPPGAYVDASAVVVRDVDGDGIEDVVTVLRVVGSGGHARHVAALSGAGYAELWRSAAISTSDAEPVALYDAGAALLVSHAATLAAYAPRDGKPLWSVAVSDRVEGVARGDGTLRVTTADRRRLVLGLTTGRPAEDAAEDEDGTPLRPYPAGYLPRWGHGGSGRSGGSERLGLTDGSFGDVVVRSAYCPFADVRAAAVEAPTRPSRSGRAGRPRPGVTDRSRPRAATLVCGGDLGVAYATARAGSGYGVLVGYDPDGNGESWRTRLAPPGSVARVAQPPQVAFGPRHVLGVYQLAGGRPRARLLTRQGTMVWDVELSVAPGGQVVGAELGPRRAYARVSRSLHVLDLGDGSVLRSIPAT